MPARSREHRFSSTYAEELMYRKIIVGYDGSEQAGDALALGRMLAGDTGAKLLLVGVFSSEVPVVPRWGPFAEGVRNQVEKALEDAAATIGTGAVETASVGSASAADALQDLAEREKADLVVLGSCHRGRVGRVLTGAVSDHLLRGAPCPVAIAPRGFADRLDDGLHVIGVAFDATPESKRALAEAARIGAAVHATLRIFAVAESKLYFGYPPVPSTYNYEETFRSMKEHLEREIAEVLETLPRTLRASGEVLSGDAAGVLSSKAEEGLDLLVAGSRGYGPARRVLLGSVSSKLARSLPCAFLVVPRAAGPGEDARGAAVGAGEGAVD
jgi:nucleotide-binding universal stress UspA family protein